MKLNVHWWWLVIVPLLAIQGCKTIEIPPIVIPPIVIGPGDSEASKCGCDLKKAIATPPYTAAQLAAAGNKEECPTIGGRDIRLNVFRAEGGAWSIGHLLPQACTSLSPVKCQCFDADGGRYHFIGYTHNTDHSQNIVKTEPGVEFKYVTTTWVWYEFRK